MSEELIDIIGTTVIAALLCLIFYFLGYFDGAGRRKE